MRGQCRNGDLKLSEASFSTSKQKRMYCSHGTDKDKYSHVSNALKIVVTSTKGK